MSVIMQKRGLAGLIENGGMLIALALFVIFLLAPAVFVFKGSVENISISLVASGGGLTFDNYRGIIEDGYFRYVFNSLYICVAATGLACLIGLLAAYGLSRLRFPGRGFIFGAIMGGSSFPGSFWSIQSSSFLHGRV